MEDIRELFAGLNLSKFKEYRREVLGLMIAVGATFLFHQYVYSTYAADIKRLDSEIQATEKEVERMVAEIQETQKTAERLREAVETVKNMEEKFLIIQKKLPSDSQLSSILNGLISGDIKKGISVTSLKPLPLESKGEYFKLPFQMTMQARYRAFGEYLERIEEMPRIITVENFRIDAHEEGGPLLSIQMYMSTYILGGQ